MNQDQKPKGRPKRRVTFPGVGTFLFDELPPHATGDLRLLAIEFAPKGSRWNLRQLLHGAPVIVDGVAYVKQGATATTLRLRKLPTVVDEATP
jgi:hypothetical protein